MSHVDVDKHSIDYLTGFNDAICLINCSGVFLTIDLPPKELQIVYEKTRELIIKTREEHE